MTGSPVFLARIPVNTSGELDVIDVTERVRSSVVESGIENGIVHLFVAGSTAGLTTIEYEPGVVADLKGAFSRMAPDDLDYAHNEAWGDGNGHSHVRAALLGPDLTVPVRGREPVLGTWQQIILVEFDVRSRSRILQLTVLGGKVM